MSKSVCMFVTNAVSNDPRVKREAAALVKAGHRVVVIGVTEAAFQENDSIDGFQIIRVPQPHPLIDCLKRASPGIYRSTKHVYRWFIDRKPESQSVERSSSSSDHAERGTEAGWRQDWRGIVSIFLLNMKFARVGRRLKADVYHAHNLDTLLAGVLAAAWSQSKLVYDFHELYTEQFASGRRTWIWRMYYRTLERALVNRAHTLLTVCESLAEWMARNYKVNRVWTVRNVPHVAADTAQALVPAREPVVLYHGNYCADRGLEQLIESAQFLDRGRIVLRGYGDLEPTLQQLVNEKRLDNRVEFAPPLPVDELIGAACHADIGILPFVPSCLNTRYCLPNKLFEYMAAGLAIVSTDLPEIRRVVADHSVGVLMQSVNPQEIARTLNGLLADRKALDLMKRNAKHAAQHVYNWERERYEFLRAYESIFASAGVVRQQARAMPTKVCMLLTNPVTDDPRVRREASTLSKAGYDLTVIGVRIEGTDAEETLDGYRIIRLPHPRLLMKLLWRKLRDGQNASRVLPLGNGDNEVERRMNVVQQSDQRFPTTLLGKCWADLLNVVNVIWINLLIAGVAARQRAAVYHAHDLDTLLAGSLAALWTGGRLVYDFHELFTEQHQKGLKTNLWRTFYSGLERLLIGRAHLRLTVCDSLGQWVATRYGVNDVVTVKNVPRLPDQGVVHTRGAPTPVILYHGAYVRNRGLEELIACAPHLRNGCIVLRGTGPLESKLRALVEKLQVQDRVTFAPAVPMSELVKAASEADIGVAPFLPVCLNTQYCLPNKLFEYMMAGLAIAATDVPEMRKIVLGHRLGVLFPSNDAKAMADSLNKLLDDKTALFQMKQNSLRAARQIYNWEWEERRLLQAYAALA